MGENKMILRGPHQEKKTKPNIDDKKLKLAKSIFGKKNWRQKWEDDKNDQWYVIIFVSIWSLWLHYKASLLTSSSIKL